MDNTVYDLDFNILKEYDLSKGYLEERTKVKDGAYDTIDNETKFALDESDYETVTVYIQTDFRTIEEIKKDKIEEINAVQQQIIKNGVEITLSDGTVEHFDLTENDQISLMGLQTMVLSGQEMIPWHTSDNTQHCKFYTNADMQIITTTALTFVSYQVTYFRDLRIYINSLNSEDDVNNIVYGMPIPEEFMSEPLKLMITQLSNNDYDKTSSETETESKSEIEETNDIKSDDVKVKENISDSTEEEKIDETE